MSDRKKSQKLRHSFIKYSPKNKKTLKLNPQISHKVFANYS
jgi:hypothetical protein